MPAGEAACARVLCFLPLASHVRLQEDTTGQTDAADLLRPTYPCRLPRETGDAAQEPFNEARLHKALAYYNADEVPDSAIRADGNGRYIAHLGEGKRVFPNVDTLVQRLALKMYHRLALDPGIIYRYVASGVFSKDVCGSDWQATTARSTSYVDGGLADVNIFCDAVGGDCHDPRLATMGYHDLPPTLLQHFAEQPNATNLKFGYEARDVVFYSMTGARLALAIQRFFAAKTTHTRQVRNSADVVLATLSYALDHPSMSVLFGTRLPEVRITPSSHIDLVVQMRSGRWESMAAETDDSNARQRSEVQELWVMPRQKPNVAVRLLFVACHWEAIPETLANAIRWQAKSLETECRANVLRHRTEKDCFLCFRQLACGAGGVVELYGSTLPSRAPPWWIASERQPIPGNLLFGGAAPESHVFSPPKRTPEAELPSLPKRPRAGTCNDEQKCSQELQHWEKSRRACESIGETIPKLIGSICIHSAVERIQVDGLTAVRQDLRECARENFADETAKRVIAAMKAAASGWGDYARAAAERASKYGDHCGCYLIRKEDETVGVFIVFLYQCKIVPHGEDTVALMIDTCGIDKKHTKANQSKGYGRIMWNMCQKVATAHTKASRILVFAQCLLDQQAGPYWRRKLDETDMARAIMLQAHNLDADKVPVQFGCCTPRAKVLLTDAHNSDAPSYDVS